MPENVPAKKRKLKFTPGETTQEIRNRVQLKEGMGDSSKAGLALLGEMSDRELFELFFQIHMRQKPLEETAVGVAQRLEIDEGQMENLAVGVNRFVEATADLVEEESEEEDYDAMWERERKTAPEVDEVGDFDVLIQIQKRWLLKCMKEEWEQPSLLRKGEYEKAVNTMATLLEKRARTAVATGDRKAPNQDLTLKFAWQTMMDGVDEEDRSRMVKVGEAVTEGIRSYLKRKKGAGEE